GEWGPSVRAAAIRLLGREMEHRASDIALIAARLDPSEPAEVQSAAVRALARLDDKDAVDAMLARWARLGPTVRAAVLDALLARPASVDRLLVALEGKRLAANEIDATHRQTLLTAGRAESRRRAKEVLGALTIGP